MAPLPSYRLEKTAPFERIGIDVFGHYFVHDGRRLRRTSGTKKIWVLIITCLYSRAVHLECLNSLDTPTFILAFRRFVALRGRCSLIVSDHGSGFLGAQSEVGTDSTLDVAAVQRGLQDQDLKWEFVPPYGSHFAGVWESKVKSVKKVLNAAIINSQQTSLSREEFNTFLQEAGAIVNETPLGEISCDPTEPYPVAPATLLTLREPEPSSNIEPPSDEDLLAYGKKRWRRVNYLAHQFWVRWKTDYMTSIGSRNKWLYPKRNIQVGDVVMVRNVTLGRSKWPMGIVSEVLDGKDGLVRRAIVKMNSNIPSGKLKERAVHDLVLVIPSESISPAK